MRISSMQIFNIANKSMANASQAVAQTQEQMSSGKRVMTAADDPVAATKIMQLNGELASIEQYNKNIDIAKNNLVLEETILSNVNQLMTRMQELAVRGGNTATLTTSQYTALAQEVDSRLDELQNLMNSQNSNGDYIFGGFKSKDEPFVGDAHSGFEYRGDSGQQFIKVANNTTVAASDSGKDIFMNTASAEKTFNTFSGVTNTSAATISVGQVVDQDAYDAFYPDDIVLTVNFDGTNYSYTATRESDGATIVGENGPLANQSYMPGEEIEINGTSVRIMGTPSDGDQFMIESSEKQDPLTTLARFSDAMKSFDGTPESKENIANIVATTLKNLENIQSSVSETVTSIGARINTLESTHMMHLDTKVVTTEVLGDIEALDYAEATTRLAAQSMVLQASQQSFIRVSQLTLFSLL